MSELESVPASIEVSKKFEKKNEEVRAYYENYRECEDNLRIKVNELALITHEENPDWTLNKIANFIVIVNQDLDGFSRANVLKNVTEENKVLLNVKVTKPKGLPSPLLDEFRKQKGESLEEEDETKLQNNVMEQENLTRDSNVIEESSRTNVVEEESPHPEVIYDDPQKIIKQYEDTIIKQNKAYEELEQKYKEAISPFEAKGSVIAPNGQEIPIIGKADPYKRTVEFEFDQKEVKKLKRF